MRAFPFVRWRSWAVVVALLGVGACAPEDSGKPSDPTPPARAATVVMNGDLLWHNTLVFDAQRAAGERSGLDFGPL